MADDPGIVGLWIDALDRAAEVAGGSSNLPLGRETTIATDGLSPRVEGKRQITLSFSRIPLEEYHEQVRNCAERKREERKLECARMEEEATKLKLQKREKERLRKQDYRARKRANEVSTVVVGDSSDASDTESTDTDESSNDLDGSQVSIIF